MMYPLIVEKVVVPPIKCQGIKTKLVPFILSNILWNGKGRWIEPFLGSGVVLFNARPDRAIALDKNPHIIKFYKDIQEGKITGEAVKASLFEHGQKLSKEGDAYYYYIRDRFNSSSDSLDFLFLSRSCFNGVMRFNSKGKFNVPFGHKLDRFRKGYVTKIVNQVEAVKDIIRSRDWVFKSGNWEDAFSEATERDFIYMDPPYIGRHTDFYDRWSEEDATKLAQWAKATPAKFALSMWDKNEFRENEHISKYWQGTIVKRFTHFYHVGSKESLRHEMTEALVLKADSKPVPLRLF